MFGYIDWRDCCHLLIIHYVRDTTQEPVNLALMRCFPFLSRTEAVKRWLCGFFIGLGGGPCPQHCAPWGPCQDQGGGPAGPGLRCESVLILQHWLSRGKVFPFIAWGLNLCLFSSFYALSSPLSPEFSLRPTAKHQWVHRKYLTDWMPSYWICFCFSWAV